MGKTKQGLREADRQRGEGLREEGKSFYMHTKYVGFTTEEANLSHCVIC